MLGFVRQPVTRTRRALLLGMPSLPAPSPETSDAEISISLAASPPPPPWAPSASRSTMAP
eukprot:8974813-Pyramimonas_sp.AAC.1